MKSIFWGLMASVLLLSLYFLVMLLAKSPFSVAVGQLNTLKFWAASLIVSFGVQVGLFVYAKELMKKVSGSSVAVGTTTSSTAMIACCAHHITDILPLIGLSILAAFLAKYQVWFFAAGLLSNLVGIGFMMKYITRVSQFHTRDEQNRRELRDDDEHML